MMSRNETTNRAPLGNTASTLNALTKPESKYETLSEIGTGAYGTVYKARSFDDGKVVALKVIKPQPNEQGLSMSTLREIASLRQIDNFDHPNIVKLFDVFPQRLSPREFILTIVFEYVDQDLSKYIEKCPPPGIDAYTVQDLMKQMLTGIDFLHSHRIVHRDMKPQNILITHDGVLKLADFGLSRIFGTDMALTSVVVTLWYRAPEVLLQDSYGRAVDLWSCGCIMAELFRKKPLFCGRSEIDQLNKIFSVMGTPSTAEWPENCGISRSSFRTMIKQPLELYLAELDSDSKDLLQKLLTFDPDSRVSAATALQHRYFVSSDVISEGDDAEGFDYSSDGFTDDCTDESQYSSQNSDNEEGGHNVETNVIESKSVIESSSAEFDNNNLNTPKITYNRGT